MRGGGFGMGGWCVVRLLLAIGLIWVTTAGSAPLATTAFKPTAGNPGLNAQEYQKRLHILGEDSERRRPPPSAVFRLVSRRRAAFWAADCPQPERCLPATLIDRTVT